MGEPGEEQSWGAVPAGPSSQMPRENARGLKQFHLTLSPSLELEKLPSGTYIQKQIDMGRHENRLRRARGNFALERRQVSWRKWLQVGLEGEVEEEAGHFRQRVGQEQTLRVREG